jgi:hypothetical protein
VSEPFRKGDGGKARFDLIDPEFELDLARAMTLGADAYGANNYKECAEPERYEAALGRHVNARRRGEIIDPVSGLPHTAHAAANLMILYWLDANSASGDADDEPDLSVEDVAEMVRGWNVPLTEGVE